MYGETQNPRPVAGGFWLRACDQKGIDIWISSLLVSVSSSSLATDIMWLSASSLVSGPVSKPNPVRMR
jgi:hypothetical protein